MIYLDYSSTTPMSLEALDAYNKTAKEYIGSIYSNNSIGLKAKEKLKETTKEISNMLNVLGEEIIYTSGATEANNMALIGVALANHKRGKHILVSKLEHSSIYEICKYLESIGFEIDYIENDQDGLIVFDDLKNKIREDTILVSIAAVNYETGIRQPLKVLRQIIKKENKETLFHSDLSQAIGKTNISFRDIDLGSVTAHKFYGPKGIGFLYKNEQVKIATLIYGNKNNIYKPGMPPLPLIVSMKEALKICLKDMDKREKYINLLSERIISKLSNIDGIRINKTSYSIPHILSLSFDNVNSLDLANNLANNDIFVNTNNLNEISNGVMAIYKELKRSKNVMIISISHLTTVIEINRFIEVFEQEYNKLNNLISG